MNLSPMAYTSVSLVSALVSWQSEYRVGLARAVDTRLPCSDERTGILSHAGFDGGASAAAVAGLGNGRSNVFANRSASSSARAGICAICGDAPIDCCRSAGLGAMAVAATVFTMRAQRYAPSTAANSVPTHEYLWRTSSTGGRNSKGHAMIPLLARGRAARRETGGRAPRDNLATAADASLTNCQESLGSFR